MEGIYIARAECFLRVKLISGGCFRVFGFVRKTFAILYSLESGRGVFTVWGRKKQGSWPSVS